MKPQSKIFAIAGVGLVLLLIGIVWYLKSFYIIQIQQKPGSSREIACTADAKVCPDGSSVGRVAPYCEFAACPEQTENAPDIGEGSVGEGVVESPIDETQTELAQIPDGPLINNVVPNPVSVPFLVEHRSALDGKTIKLKGTIVELNILQPPINCGPNQPCSQTGMYMPPQITLAESIDPTRDKRYDVRVLLPESVREQGEADYLHGTEIEVVGTVSGTISSLIVLGQE